MLLIPTSPGAGKNHNNLSYYRKSSIGQILIAILYISFHNFDPLSEITFLETSQLYGQKFENIFFGASKKDETIGYDVQNGLI